MVSEQKSVTKALPRPIPSESGFFRTSPRGQFQNTQLAHENVNANLRATLTLGSLIDQLTK